MTTRPTKLPRWADAGGGIRVEPNSAKKDSGFAAGEEPAAGHHNFLFGDAADWIQYLDAVAQRPRERFVQSYDSGLNVATEWASVAVFTDSNGNPYLYMYTDNGDERYSYNGIDWRTPSNPVPAVGVSVRKRAFAYDSANGRMMVCGYNGIAYTTDPISGSWTLKTTPGTGFTAWCWDDVNAVGMCLDKDDKLYRFSDITAGSPFTASTTTLGGTSVGYEYSNSVAYDDVNDSWVCVQDTMYVSTDGGDTWAAPSTPPFGSTDFYDVIYVPSAYDQTAKLIAIGRDTTPTPDVLEMWSSDDGGDTWTDVSSKLLNGMADTGVATSQSGNMLHLVSASEVAITMNNGASGYGRQWRFISRDGCETWQELTVGDGFANIDTFAVVELNGGLVMLTVDGASNIDFYISGM